MHEYEYLAIDFLSNEFLDLDKSIQRVFDSGNQALRVVLAKRNASGGLAILFQCLPSCIMLLNQCYLQCSKQRA